MKRSSFVFSTLAVTIGTMSVVVACGSSSDDTTTASTDAGGADRARLPAPLRPDASCPVVIDSPAVLESPHVPEGTQVQYNSNPPSSGPHYPVWANFQEFSSPVEDGYLVHSLEHGAVVLLYKCSDPDAGSCTALVEELRKVRDAIPTDPRCDSATRVRVVIAPSPRITSTVAAAAWGWTYNGDCVDLPTLTAFAKDHYAQGTEDFCTPGKTSFGPSL